MAVTGSRTARQRYEIRNASGEHSSVMARCHHQHIWSETTLPVSASVQDRIRAELGDGPLSTTVAGREIKVNLGQCPNCGWTD